MDENEKNLAIAVSVLRRRAAKKGSKTGSKWSKTSSKTKLRKYDPEVVDWEELFAAGGLDFSKYDLIDADGKYQLTEEELVKKIIKLITKCRQSSGLHSLFSDGKLELTRRLKDI